MLKWNLNAVLKCLNEPCYCCDWRKPPSLPEILLSSYSHIFRVSEVRSAAMSGANSLGHRSQTSPGAV